MHRHNYKTSPLIEPSSADAFLTLSLAATYLQRILCTYLTITKSIPILLSMTWPTKQKTRFSSVHTESSQHSWAVVVVVVAGEIFNLWKYSKSISNSMCKNN